MIILLDYDGTIVPIKPKPELAKIDKETKKLLLDLAEKHTVGIVTGRSFENFKNVFGEIPEKLYIITVHGLKIYKGEKLLKENRINGMPDLKPLEEELKKFKGVMLEIKEGCFAVHYREFNGDEKAVIEVFEKFIKKHPPEKIIRGKKILEAIYGNFDKGKGVEDLLKLINWNRKEKVIYIGDDTTDLYALKKVKELGGIAIFVGKENYPFVDFYLGSYRDVIKLLESFREGKDFQINYDKIIH